jgi:hypothetical protein
MANLRIGIGDIDEAVILQERAALSQISADYLSRGAFSKYENDFLDSCLSASESDYRESIERLKHDFLKKYPLYGPLWGEPDVTNPEFRRDLGPSEAIVRFYVRPDSAAVFYIDADTVAYNIIKINTVELRENVDGLQEMMRNQRRADSLLEKWYTLLISDFEDLMQNREEIMLIPDGPLVGFPLEALKMPGGDYLGEMFSAISEPGRYLPCVDTVDSTNGNHIMEVIESVCEAIGDCHGREAGRVRFAVNVQSSDRELSDGEIMCFLDMSDYSDGDEFLVDLLKMRKGGYEQSIQTLWPTTDQAAAYYYWVLLDKLRQGKGITESHRAAKSFLYGRYRGSVYYWPSQALYSLN